MTYVPENAFFNQPVFHNIPVRPKPILFKGGHEIERVILVFEDIVCVIAPKLSVIIIKCK